MENEQTAKIDDTGTKDSQALAADGKPLSDYDKALALVKRREEATAAEREVLEEKKKLAANEMLGSSAGGHVEAKQVSPEDAKAEASAKYFEGTQLETDIRKANE